MLPPPPPAPGAKTKAGLLTVLLPLVGFLAGALLGYVFGGGLDHLLIHEDCYELDPGCPSGLVQTTVELYGTAFGLLVGFQTAKRLRARIAPTYNLIIQPVSAAKDAWRSKRYGTFAIGLSLIPLFGFFAGWILGVRAINSGWNAKGERFPQVGIRLGIIAIGIAAYNVQITNQSL